MSVFLGVDGGGTKTAFALVDSEGEILARAQKATTYYFGSGIEMVSGILDAGVAEVCRTARVARDDIRSAFFGLPGYGEVSRDMPYLDALPAQVLGHDRYRCGNDMVAGWAGSLGAQDGINVVAGTGSLAYGERGGRARRVGGWGELFGDEGSGYWVATRGLNAFTRMSDGRLPRGPLYPLIRERTEVTADLDVIDVVYNRWGRSRTEVAALSRVVAEAQSHGDAVAEEILADAADELADLVDTARRALGFDPDERVLVSYSGGVFNAAFVRERFGAALLRRSPTFSVREPLFDPATGAAVYAAKSSGDPLPAPALANLRQSMLPRE